jgi:hypothetical protein
MSGYVRVVSAEGFAGKGFPGNTVQGNILYNDTGNTRTKEPVQRTILSLYNLPNHNKLDLGFLLPLIDTWDPSDYFNVAVDGALIFRETFYNSSHDPSYPPAGQSYTNRNTIAAIGRSYGFEGWWDSLYDMSREDAKFGAIPHRQRSVTIEWWADGPGWNRPANEAWGLDNISLHAIPEVKTSLITGSATVLLALAMLIRSRWFPERALR